MTDSRYANKLVSEKGLAISVYDIMTAEDGKVTWGNGLMYYKGRLSFTCSCYRKQAEISVLSAHALRSLHRRGDRR